MRVLTVVGNRPQLVKAAAVSRLLREQHEEILVHTGQHYDDDLSAVFLAELGIPAPERQLRLGTGTNSEQLARMLAALAPIVAEAAPDAVLVYGDTNSTLAGAMAADRTGIPVAHVEAGMRSFDRRMPEEHNRILTDQLATLLLCSSDVAAANLEREDVTGIVRVVGDVMVDVALLVQPRAATDDAPLAAAGVTRGEYLLVTAHRAGNVDDPKRLELLVALLEALPRPAVLPLHPRTATRLRAAGLDGRLAMADHVIVTAPLGYLAFTALLTGAHAVLTDSGGVQKEAYLAGVPCVTLRDTTEWVETVDAGWNVLVDLDAAAALAALERPAPDRRPALYGDGHAGARVVAALADVSWR